MSILFELHLIEVFNWGEKNQKSPSYNLSNRGKIQLIENVWFEGADYPDFYRMPMFKYKDWYLEALKKEGTYGMIFVHSSIC